MQCKRLIWIRYPPSSPFLVELTTIVLLWIWATSCSSKKNWTFFEPPYTLNTSRMLDDVPIFFSKTLVISLFRIPSRNVTFSPNIGLNISLDQPYICFLCMVFFQLAKPFFTVTKGWMQTNRSHTFLLFDTFANVSVGKCHTSVLQFLIVSFCRITTLKRLLKWEICLRNFLESVASITLLFLVLESMSSRGGINNSL
jgi:hypothetical protein